MHASRELTPEEVYRRVDPDAFEFETTADLKDLTLDIGQQRAVEAMEFGLHVERDGYNIFALGPTGMDKHGFVRRYFEDQARSDPTPDDWCYVHNFDEAHRPRIISLPAGMGTEFRQDMDGFVQELHSVLSEAFESEEYQTRQQVLQQELEDRQQKALLEVQEQAKKQGIALLRTPSGLAFAPSREGEVLSREEVEKLSEEQRAELEGQIESLQEHLQKAMLQAPIWRRELRTRVQELNREVAGVAVAGLMADLKEKYAAREDVTGHLEAVQKDIVENAPQFVSPQQEVPEFLRAMMGDAAGPASGGAPSAIRRYQVNLLVAHSPGVGAPVVYEDNPSYLNLVGRVEHLSQMGALVTDFLLIKPGALHRANGGYLILDARKLLSQPYAWDGLKRVLQARQIRLESVAQMLSAISTVSLEPTPIPIDMKVAVVGERDLYYTLHELDPEFAELFKVTADFEETVDRTDENQMLYARLVASTARKLGLRPLDRVGTARVIEEGSRLVGDTQKLSTHRRTLNDLLVEADYWAGQDGRAVVSHADVQQAIDARVRRLDRIREHSYEAIERGTVLIDTEGATVGQINGLSVMGLGDFAFGRPSRITAQVRMGKGDVVDIEREVDLGGPIHSKGVMILSSFLAGRYAGDRPMSLSASLVFEQSYGGVEGDSASSAELYALLSAIAGVPIKQGLAVTGSVNQRGQVQAIGGVNYKIEGFFDVCQARGLTGEQGVLIPQSNVQHLMLRHDVVKAIAEHRFHVYPVQTVDQGVELLTEVPAGDRDEDGSYPEGSINQLVEERLQAMADTAREMAAPLQEEDEA